MTLNYGRINLLYGSCLPTIGQQLKITNINAFIWPVFTASYKTAPMPWSMIDQRATQ